MKYHLTSSSGSVKGNNPFILSRMTVSDDFRRSGTAPSGLVGYDAQGNMISADPAATITAGYETSSFAMYGSEDAYTHPHTVLPQTIQTFSTNQMVKPQIPAAPRSMLTSQMLQQLNHAHSKSINPHLKKSKKHRPQYVSHPAVPTTTYVPQVPSYDQITTYSQYSTGMVGGIQNPALMHRNNQINHYRQVDQTNSGVPTPSESGIPLVPNGDYQRQIQQAQNSINGFFSEPKMDNGLWYKRQAGQHSASALNTGVEFGSYNKWETGSTLDDAFREPSDSKTWKP